MDESRKFGLLRRISAVDATQKIPGQAVKNGKALLAPMGGIHPEPSLEIDQWGKAFPCRRVKGDFSNCRQLAKNRPSFDFLSLRWS
jgi:hypothetical protein